MGRSGFLADLAKVIFTPSIQFSILIEEHVVIVAGLDLLYCTITLILQQVDPR